MNAAISLSTVSVVILAAHASFAQAPSPVLPGNTAAAPTTDTKSEAKTQAADSAERVTVDPVGLAIGPDPLWAIIADANLNTLDVGSPTVGFGIQRTTSTTTLRLSFKKNAAASKVEAEAGSRDLGRAIASPDLANFGMSVHVEKRFGVYVIGTDTLKSAKVQCLAPGSKQDKTLTPAEEAEGGLQGQGLSKVVCHTRWAHGMYVDTALVSSRFTVTSDGKPVTSAEVTPLKLSLGYMWSLQGTIPVTLAGSNAASISLYAGATARFIVGDIQDGAREKIFGNKSVAYAGGEAGAQLQLANVLLTGELSALVPTQDWAIAPGLSNFQLFVRTSFILPWRVLGGAGEAAK
jgi:hypothetical protein